MSTMMMERTSMGMPTVPGLSAPLGAPTQTPFMPNWLMVPRCTFKVEKCQGGMKVTCVCEDKLACTMVQNLCQMLAGGLCGCSVTCNGMTVCQFNWTMGLCRWEPTSDGVCFWCTSGDSQCCEMIQSWCDCLCSLLECGCTCCFTVNQTPVCCGGSESTKTTHKSKK
jgi:hypothetical protein